MKPAQVVRAVGVGVAIAAVAGFLNCKSAVPDDPCLTPGPHTIVVGINGSLSCPTVVVHPGDRITWTSPSGTRLTLQLQATNLGQPECPPTGGTTNVCAYTASNISTSSQTSDYDGALTGGSPNPAPIHGRIIIKK